MKNKIFTLFILVGVLSFAQVGINTDQPTATLDVRAPETPFTGQANKYKNGGLRLAYPGDNISQLPTDVDIYNSTSSWEGAEIVRKQNILVQDAETGKVDHLKRSAFSHLPIRSSNISPTLYEEDYTILIRNNFTLTNVNRNIGQVVNLAYNDATGAPRTVTGDFRLNGSDSASLVLSPTNRSYTVQSDGNHWYVIDASQVNDAFVIDSGDDKTKISTNNTLNDVLNLPNQNILIQDDVTGEINHIKRSAFTFLPAKRTSDGPITSDDYTILVRENVVLPTGAEYIGKTLNLVYDFAVQTPLTITSSNNSSAIGQIKINGGLTTSLELSTTKRSYTLQSNGTRWYVVGGYEVDNATPPTPQEPNIRVLQAGGQILASDDTLLLKGDVTLPTPTSTAFGKKYTLVHDTTFIVNLYIYGIGNLNLSLNGTSASGLTVQNDGTRWVVINRF